VSKTVHVELGGGVVIDVLCDAIADHPRALPDAFPGTPAAGWDAARRAFPATVGAAGRWRLPVHVALVRTQAACVLVDAGVGPAGTTAARWLGVPGTLEADLAALGVTPDEIDVVFLTHLHQDHVGWLAAPGSPHPTFSSARHVVGAPEWDSVQQNGTPVHVRDAFAPVLSEGLLDVGGALPAGMWALPLPGHSAGHAGLLIEGDGQRLLFAGDAFNHPLQLTEPEVPSLADADRAQATATRRRLLHLAREDGLTIAGAHLPGALWPASSRGMSRS
jgi:glyoxylase-like metal-dependent hydrolase (beta-lactamase superfamily II)